MAESGASVESSTPGGVQVWRPWIVVALAGLLVVVAAAAAGLLVRPDPVREVAAGESLVLAASPPTTEDTVTRDVTLDAGVSVRLTTQGALGETLDVVPPEGGSFVVVRVTDPGWGVGTVDAVAVPTTVTLVDGSRRTEVTGATTPARLAGVRYTTTAVAVERSGEDAYRGLSLEAERGGSVTSVDLAPTSPEPVPPVPSEVPGARAVPCAPLDWPDGWAPEDNQYDDCTAAAYPLVRTLGVLGPAPDGSVWLPVVVDPEGGFLRATRSDGTYRLASIPAEVAYRLGELEPAFVAPLAALQSPDRVPTAEPDDLVVFAVPEDARIDELVVSFTATYDAERRGPGPRATTTVELQRSAALGE